VQPVHVRCRQLNVAADGGGGQKRVFMHNKLKKMAT
jgi:hypothetical protein